MRAAAELGLAEKFQARVRLTGAVPIADEEFSTIRHGAILNTCITIVGVLIILWLALRSLRIIAAVFLSLMTGLAVTSAAGLAMVGSFNLISAAFAVLFVGLGVDFACSSASVIARSVTNSVTCTQQSPPRQRRRVGHWLSRRLRRHWRSFRSFLRTTGAFPSWVSVC